MSLQLLVMYLEEEEECVLGPGPLHRSSSTFIGL